MAASKIMYLLWPTVREFGGVQAESGDPATRFATN